MRSDVDERLVKAGLRKTKRSNNLCWCPNSLTLLGQTKTTGFPVVYKITILLCKSPKRGSLFFLGTQMEVWGRKSLIQTL